MRRLGAALVVLVAAACGGGDDGAAPSDTATSTTTPRTDATTSTSTTIIPTTTVPTTTASVAPTTTSTAPTTTSTTTTTLPGPDCDLDEAAALLDDALALGRLAAGGSWDDDTAGAAFDDRTNSVEEFAGHTTFDCSARLAQRTGSGAERLALVGWNERRHALVVQATDPPSTPYGTDIVFQLYFEQPRGEFVVDQFVWAATMAGGESIVIATDDYSIAITAKSWQMQAPELEDLPPTLAAEQHGIATLRAAGGRNVAVAEPAPFGSTIGAIMFNTPWSLSAIATVGPATDLDPMVPIVGDGDTTFHDVDGVRVRVTTGTELGLVLHEAGFVCGDHAWRLEAILGSPAELLEFATEIVRSSGC